MKIIISFTVVATILLIAWPSENVEAQASSVTVIKDTTKPKTEAEISTVKKIPTKPEPSEKPVKRTKAETRKRLEQAIENLRLTKAERDAKPRKRKPKKEPVEYTKRRKIMDAYYQKRSDLMRSYPYRGRTAEQNEEMRAKFHKLEKEYIKNLYALADEMIVENGNQETKESRSITRMVRLIENP